MRLFIRWSVGLFVVLVLGAQFIRPGRTNPAAASDRALAAIRPMPAHVAAIFERACRDCHSNDTRWPWYSRVAPVSWFVIDHVDHGRSHFNASDWARYDAEEAARLLKRTCELVRDGSMPLGSYLLVHRGAKLDAADRDAVCAWALAPPPGAMQTGSGGRHAMEERKSQSQSEGRGN